MLGKLLLEDILVKPLGRLHLNRLVILIYILCSELILNSQLLLINILKMLLYFGTGTCCFFIFLELYQLIIISLLIQNRFYSVFLRLVYQGFQNLNFLLLLHYFVYDFNFLLIILFNIDLFLRREKLLPINLCFTFDKLGSINHKVCVLGVSGSVFRFLSH